MYVTFIGCGDAFAKELGNNSALVEFGETNLLIDIPDSNYMQMHKVGRDYSDIQNLFISHLHGDHINGLERFAYYRTFATPVVRPNESFQKPNLYVPETLYMGLWDAVKNGLGITVDGFKTLEDYFTVHLIPFRNGIGSFTIEGVNFELVETDHVPNMNVYGLLVDGEFYYSADSTFQPDTLYRLLPRVKKVFHDIHFLEADLAVHASVRDFTDLQPNEKEKIYAMHYNESHLDIQEVDGIKLVKPGKTISI